MQMTGSHSLQFNCMTEVLLQVTERSKKNTIAVGGEPQANHSYPILYASL